MKTLAATLINVNQILLKWFTVHTKLCEHNRQDDKKYSKE